MNLVQATAFNMQDYKIMTVKIGASGINRDNGQSIVTYNYPGNIYKATFTYTYYAKTGLPDMRTESYYEDGVLKGTAKEVFSYTGCD